MIVTSMFSEKFVNPMERDYRSQTQNLRTACTWEENRG